MIGHGRSRLVRSGFRASANATRIGVALAVAFSAVPLTATATSVPLPLAARGETQRRPSLVLFVAGGVAETSSTPSTAAFRLLPSDKKYFARSSTGFHHGLLAARGKKKKKKKDGLTAEQATDRRAPVQAEGRRMIEAGEFTAATIFYEEAADNAGDPILYLDAADAYLSQAESDLDIASAETAKLRAATAEDILYFHLDDASDPDYRQVTDNEISGLLARVVEINGRADDLIATIEAELAAADAPVAAESKPKGNGKIMRISGAGLMGLGVAGLGVGAAGLIIGRVNQTKVEDPAVYGTEFDDFDSKGKRGNVLAGVGLAVGGVALAAGATLFIIGRRRGKKAGEAPPPDDDASVALVPNGRGFSLVGRF